MRRVSALLVAAVVCGAGLGLTAAARDASRQRLPRDAIASVDGETIARAELDRALSALAADKRAPLTGRDQARVLERLVDEQLLLDAALEAGVHRTSRSVRERIARVVIESVVARAPVDRADDSVVESYLSWLRGRATIVKAAEAGR